MDDIAACFFFSSRRRHTRFDCDWSSDVCSSDLAWVPGLALLVYMAFPSSASNVAPLLEPGGVAEHEVIAPFTFPVNKSDQELAREAEELASTVKPIYEFQQRAFDSATIALHAFFAAMQNAADQGGPQAVMRVAKEQGVVLSAAEAAYLAKGGKRRGLERALTDLLDRKSTRLNSSHSQISYAVFCLKKKK